jgi:hypothetical protein
MKHSPKGLYPVQEAPLVCCGIGSEGRDFLKELKSGESQASGRSTRSICRISIYTQDKFMSILDILFSGEER